ncbi:hypothetical protein FRC12_006834 [Ceratobasidium sp. 428]|nr:hypothetical protein FRC12_006834 [Ceratobasidium sp. 428]
MRKERDNNRDRIVCVEIQLRRSKSFDTAKQLSAAIPNRSPFTLLPHRLPSLYTLLASSSRDGGGSALPNPRMSFNPPPPQPTSSSSRQRSISTQASKIHVHSVSTLAAQYRRRVLALQTRHFARLTTRTGIT